MKAKKTREMKKAKKTHGKKYVQLELEGVGDSKKESERERKSRERKERGEAHKRFMEKLPESGITDTIASFMAFFHVSTLLAKSGIVNNGAGGLPAGDMFTFILSQVFRQHSIYRQEQMGTLPEGVSTSSVSRFLNNQLFRWESFLALLSKAMYIFIDGLTGKDRKKALVADDSDYDRTIRSREKIGGGKKNSKKKNGKKKKEKKEKKNKGRRTEFAARKYDHARKRHSIGFRMLTLGFTDGFTFIPLCFSLLSSRRDDCVVGDKDAKGLDKRGFAYKRRKLARSATMDVLVTLVKRALAYVKSVRHICVDRWFSSPAQIVALRDATGLHVITVLKHGNAKFEFNGVEMTIKQIFEQVKKNKGRSRYLSEALIKIVKNGVAIKVVFVRNRANRKEWIAIATTDTSLASEDIIEYYALRWDIEKYFWTIKMHLHLTDECHSTSYDALTAHATIVAVRYMLLAYEKRNNEDDKTFGGLIAMVSEEAKSMAVSEILGVFADAVFDSIDHVVGMTNEMKEMFVDQLLSRLPEDVTKLLAFAYGKSGGEASAGQV